MVMSAELHALDCTGPDEHGSCPCRAPRGNVRLLDMHRRAPDWQVVDHASRSAVDGYLDNLESLLIALGQRDIYGDQLDRLARLLQGAERTALARARRR